MINKINNNRILILKEEPLKLKLLINRLDTHIGGMLINFLIVIISLKICLKLISKQESFLN